MNTKSNKPVLFLRLGFLSILFAHEIAMGQQLRPRVWDQTIETIQKRTPFQTYTSSYVNIDTTRPGQTWRILAAPSTTDFEALLAEEEKSGAFDLVFPIATESMRSFANDSPYPGALCDRFLPIARSGPGMEYRIGFDGRWECIELSRSDNADFALVLPKTFENSDVLLNSTRAGGTDQAMVWTGRWRTLPVAPPTSLRIPNTGEWLVLRRLWQPEKDLANALTYPMQDWNAMTLRMEQSCGAKPPTFTGRENDWVVWIPRKAAELRTLTRNETLWSARFAESSSASKQPAVLGGALPILRDGEWTDPQKTLPGLRPDLKQCFTEASLPYAWIGYSPFAEEVWLGWTDQGMGRQLPMQPSDLAAELQDRKIDSAAICATDPMPFGVRWNGRWQGTPRSIAPRNVTAALCMRASSNEPNAIFHWKNLLRSASALLRVENVDTPQGYLCDTVRDGHYGTGGNIEAVWCASPRHPEEPVALDIDLQKTESIHCIRMIHASMAGYSHHFNTTPYKWYIRDAPSRPWQPVVEVNNPVSEDSTVHAFPQPVEARYWRLEIPPQAVQDVPKLVRFPEIEFWTPTDGTTTFETP
jgi:hypothetical protein